MSEPPGTANTGKEDGFAERLEQLDEDLAKRRSRSEQARPEIVETAEVDSKLAGARNVLKLINQVRNRDAETDRERRQHEETVVRPSNRSKRPAIEKPSDPVSIDQQIGPYVIQELIARGGMGVVFRARDPHLDRSVALKMMVSGPFAFEEEKLRFQGEAEAAARLDHPGIVPIHDVGEHHGQPYFAMGLVDGGSLSERIRREPLEPRAAAELTLQIAEAVQYAHRKGVIHRDIKPSNILLDSDDRPRITDFGLARRTDSVSDLTGTEQVLGTPGYMAPEQATGQTRSAGPLADVYSIGATLYCTITGRPPFQASSPAETLKLALDSEPIAPHQLNPSIPVDLNTICLKCLQKDPARRYPSADELAADLRRFRQQVPIVARPISTLERFGKWSRRHPLVAWLSAAIAASLLALIIGGLWYQTRLNRTLAELTTSRAETTDQLYRSLTGEATFLNKVRPLGYGPRVKNLIAEATQLDADEKDLHQLRQLAVSSLGFVGAREPLEFPAVDATIRSTNVDRQWDQLIVGLENGVLVSFDLESGKQRQRLKIMDAPLVRIDAQPANDEDSRKRLRVISQFGRNIAHVTLDHEGRMELDSVVYPEVPNDFLGIEATPDGRYLVGVQPATAELAKIQDWVSPSSLMVANDVREGRRELDLDQPSFFWIASLPEPLMSTRKLDARISPRFDLNEHYLVIGHSWLDDPTTDDSVVICNHHTGEIEQEVNATCGALLNVRISRLGYFVAVGGQDGFEIFERHSGNRIARNDTLGPCTVQTFVGDDGDILVRTERELLWFSPGHLEPLARFDVAGQRETLQVSGHGRYLVSTGTRNPRIVDVRGSARVRMRAHSKTAKSVSFSRDGRLLISTTRYYGGNPSKVWDAESGQLLFEFVGAESVFSPNGKWVACWSRGGLKLWDVAQGTLVASARFDFFPASIRFSPQSDRIVIATRFPGQFGLWQIEGADADQTDLDGITSPIALRRVLEDAEASAPVAFSPSGDRLAFARGDKIQVYDLAAHEPLRNFDPQENLRVDSIGFRSDDQLLVIADHLQLWDLTTGKRRWISSDRHQTPLLFSPDRSHLLCRRKLLRASNFEEIFELPAWLGSVASADWSPDGRRLAFGMDRGDVTVWNLPAVQASLQSQQLSWGTPAFSKSRHDPAVSQMLAVGNQAADEFAPEQWNRRYDNLMMQLDRGMERSWILRETYWLAEHVDRIGSRPFFETSSNESETAQRLGNVLNLARLLQNQKEHAAARDLLAAMQRAFEKMDSPSLESLRLASQLYHLSGDLYNFQLSDAQASLQAYAREGELLSRLLEQTDAKSSLTVARFWMNRNAALAHQRSGEPAEAERRLRAAIGIAEEFPDAHFDRQLIEEARALLDQWNTTSDDGKS